MKTLKIENYYSKQIILKMKDTFAWNKTKKNLMKLKKYDKWLIFEFGTKIKRTKTVKLFVEHNLKYDPT